METKEVKRLWKEQQVPVGPPGRQTHPPIITQVSLPQDMFSESGYSCFKHYDKAIECARTEPKAGWVDGWGPVLGHWQV